MITSSDLRKFKEVYKKYFGVDLKTAEARTKLELLVRHVELIQMPAIANDDAINVNEDNYEQSQQSAASNR